MIKSLKLQFKYIQYTIISFVFLWMFIYNGVGQTVNESLPGEDGKKNDSENTESVKKSEEISEEIKKGSEITVAKKNLAAQENKANNNKSQNADDKAADENGKKKKAAKLNIKKKKKDKNIKISGKDYGLLEITEGNFKYKRIPDIELPEIEKEELEEEVVITTDEEIINSDLETTINTSQNEEDKKGIFGISKKVIDTIIILILIIVIVGIIILLKIKSKDRGDGVLRRFPGA